MRYYLIAGEASGDLHGSNLIKGLVIKDPEAEFRFWGGDKMSEATASGGGEAVAPIRHYKEGAVMGFTDVMAKIGKILGNLSFCRQDILNWKPDVVILIDYPGFNLKIAKFCHRHSIKVFYYIAPKTWASRSGRNSQLKKYIDRLFIVFPFEQEYFKNQGIPFSYCGNPLLDAVDNWKYSRPVDGHYIALLPGSRAGEISRMMPVCLKVADTNGWNIVIAGAPSRSIGEYQSYIGERKNVTVVFDRTYDVLKYADAAIINSGTASLEAALIGTPQVVCWSTTPLTAFIAKYILRVMSHIKFISLGNLCLRKLVFKELIQDDFTARNVADEVQSLLSDTEYAGRMKDDYMAIRESLGTSGASEAVASEMISLLRQEIANNQLF